MACEVLIGFPRNRKPKEETMNNLDIESIDLDQLSNVNGGWDWKQFGASVGTWGAGGAVAGGITGAATTGVGAPLGALAGGVGGAISGGVYNAGQQFGWWK